MDPPLPVPAGRIQRWIRDSKSLKEPKSNGRAVSGTAKSSHKKDDGPRLGEKEQQEELSEMRYDAYMSLVDHKIRNAYVCSLLVSSLLHADFCPQLYSLYLSPLNFDSVVFPLYIAHTTKNHLVRFALSQQLRSAAKAELLKEATVIDVQSLHRECERAFSALSTLLGDDEYFFGDKQPSLFDASMFAYTNILLDQNLQWQVRHLAEGLEKHGNLIRHKDRILERYYGANS